MKKTMINEAHIEGLLYEHDLKLKVTGENSKNPGTPFISGTVSIATDNACVNIVPIHYTYVVEQTKNGGVNATFTALKNIIDGVYKTVMKDGKDIATMVRADSAIGLNEFFSDRNGQPELVSAKRNEGGFIHTADNLLEDENNRNTFKTDILITGTRRIEADPEKETEEKLMVKGYIFDFKKALLPVEYAVVNPAGMNYFESLNASMKEPTFTQVWGNQVSVTVVKQIKEESAWGGDHIKEVPSSHKEFVITGSLKVPYVWDDESSILATEMAEALAERETYIATIKQRQDDYKATKAVKPVATGAPAGIPTYNF